MTVVALADAESARRFGGKAACLARAVSAELPVPAGFAVAAGAVERLIAGDAAVRADVTPLPARLGGAVAARSSAIGEDGETHSFAGQHETHLNVTTGDALADAIARVHASARSPGALAYRRHRGIAGEPSIGVVVQQLVAADCAGVLLTMNPVTGADELVAEAAWGLGEAVVAGRVTPDVYRLARDGTVCERTIGDKDVAILPSASGGTRETRLPPDRAARPWLDAAQVRTLHGLACMRAFGPRLDLEWAIVEQTIYLLQWRPMTASVR